MVDTQFYLPPAQKDRLAAVYGVRRTAQIERAPNGKAGQGDYVEGPRVAFSGGAGLLSTARDYGRFLQMMLNGGELDGVRLLSPKTVELMTVNHVGTLFAERGPADAGDGLRPRLRRRGGPRPERPLRHLGAFGWGGAYHTNYWVDPHEKLVARDHDAAAAVGRLGPARTLPDARVPVDRGAAHAAVAAAAKRSR